MSTTAMPTTRRKKKINVSSIVFFLIGLVLAIIIASPLLYCVNASFMTEAQIYQTLIFPSELYLGNYTDALRIAPIFTFVLNSTFVAFVCTFMQLLTGSFAGYAFALLKFKGQKTLFYLFLATMMIPGNAIIISNYLTMAHLKMLDTHWALFLPYMTSAFCIFNMRQSFKGIPIELNEAAIIDGCNSLQFFIHVGIPLTLPFLGALGIYTFLQIWNQYLWPLLVVNKTELRTVQIGIGMLKGGDGIAYGPIMAGTTLILIPSILVFVLGQKSLISGLTAGAVKG